MAEPYRAPLLGDDDPDAPKLRLLEATLVAATAAGRIYWRPARHVEDEYEWEGSSGSVRVSRAGIRVWNSDRNRFVREQFWTGNDRLFDAIVERHGAVVAKTINAILADLEET